MTHGDPTRFRVRTDGTVQAGFSREDVALALESVLEPAQLEIALLDDGVVRDLARSATDDDATLLVRAVERAGLRVWRELEVPEPSFDLGLDIAPRPRADATPAPASSAPHSDLFSSDLELGSGHGGEWLGDHALAIPLDRTEAAPPIVARASFPPPVRSPSDPAVPRPVLDAARAEAATLARTRPSAPRREATPARVPIDEITLDEPAHHIGLDGRIGRVRYLVRASLLPTLIVLVATLLAPMGPRVATGALLVGVGAAFVLSLCATVARLHDLNLSGTLVLAPFLSSCLVQPALASSKGSLLWFLVASLLALASVLMTLALLFVPGTRGENTYGREVVRESSTYRVLVVVLVLAIIVASLAVYRVAESAIRAALTGQ